MLDRKYHSDKVSTILIGCQSTHYFFCNCEHLRKVSAPEQNVFGNEHF